MGHGQPPPLEGGNLPPEKAEDKLASKANDQLQGDIAKQGFEGLNSQVTQFLTSVWLKAFILPFLLVGVLVGYAFGHHQYKDITITHSSQYQNYSEADAVKSAWESALLFGLIGGIAAGFIGVAGYGCFMLCRKFVPDKG